MTRKNILIIADDKSKIQLLESRISAYDCRAASISLSEADKTENITSSKPDLILVEAGPENIKESVQAIKALRKVSGIPVLFICTFTDDMLLRSILTVKPSAILIEPVSEAELNLNITIALDKYHYEKKLSESEASLRRMIRNLIEKLGKAKPVPSEIIGLYFPANNNRGKKISGQEPEKSTEIKQLRDGLKLLIDEHRAKEEQYISTLEELNRSNKELEQYAYVASHDLQEPIRMISNYAQLLAKKYNGQLDEKGEEYIRYLTEGAKRINSLIQDLLTYSRISAKLYAFEKVNCNSTLENVLTRLKAEIEQSGINVLYTSLPTITADCTLIDQLFYNLISNAIKFRRKENPEISIDFRDNTGEWEFCFTDNGIGIKEEFFGKIFSMFQRLNDREKYPGNGIGLAICRGIVEKHSGRIWVESELGKNTSFYFRIPKKLRQKHFFSLAQD